MKKLLLINTIALAMIGCGGGSSHHHSSSAATTSASSVVSSSAATTSSSSVATSSVVATSSSSSSAPVSNWEMVWNDEFNGSEIDSSKWSFERNCTGGGNNELQCYTSRAENASVSDGKLHIVARKETFNGQSKNDDDTGYDVNDTSVQRDYTSARLRTKNKGDWKYGRIEINAKLPQGQGLWPAIWMLPTEWKYGGWPRSGEVDIMEAVNSNTVGAGNNIYGTLHYGDSWPNNKSTGTSAVPATNVWDTFHTYAIEWEEGEIRWYVDDMHFATETKDGWFTYYWAGQEQGFKVGDGDAPFDQLFHVILNVAVGGQWPGNPNNATQFPQEMTVDYVRVYRCTLDTVTGKGCASHVDANVTPLAGTPKPVQKTFSLFKDGPTSLTQTLGSNTVVNQLVPGFYDNGMSGNVISNPALTYNTGKVWDLQFTNSPGNAFLTSTLAAPSATIDDGLKFVNTQTNGELKFDMLVESADPATKLVIKLDSGWPNVSYREIETPTVGQWTSVSVPFEKLLPNNFATGQVNMDKITNAFVIEPSGGTAHVKLNNIRVQCILDCALNPVLKAVSSVLNQSFDVFVDDVDPNWDFGIGVYDTAGGSFVTTSKVASADAGHGNVLDVTFGTSNNNGLVFIQATSGKNVSSFAANGYLTFDVKVLNYAANTSGLVVKVDCGNPCSTGDINIGKVADGAWQTITIPVSNMVTNAATANGGNFDLTKVNTPFIILPKWGEQNGVHLQLDNIRWMIQ